jgi:outer membrane biosynthesis protein TonB
MVTKLMLLLLLALTSTQAGFWSSSKKPVKAEPVAKLVKAKPAAAVPTPKQTQKKQTQKNQPSTAPKPKRKQQQVGDLDLGKYTGCNTQVSIFLRAVKTMPELWLQSQIRLILVPHVSDPTVMKSLQSLFSLRFESMKLKDLKALAEKSADGKTLVLETLLKFDLASLEVKRDSSNPKDSIKIKEQETVEQWLFSEWGRILQNLTAGLSYAKKAEASVRAEVEAIEAAVQAEKEAKEAREVIKKAAKQAEDELQKASEAVKKAEVEAREAAEAAEEEAREAAEEAAEEAEDKAREAAAEM